MGADVYDEFFIVEVFVYAEVQRGGCAAVDGNAWVRGGVCVWAAAGRGVSQRAGRLDSERVLPGVLPPSGLKVTSLVKAFDMSENGSYLLRSAKVFVNQKNLKAPAALDYLAGTCTPYLSPTGMVMPVSDAFPGTDRDAHKRYNNHFSFIKSLAEHSYDGNPETNNQWPSSFGGAAVFPRHYLQFGIDNVEESSAVTDGNIYTRLIDGNGTHLVKPIASNQIVRGRKISFRMPFNIGGCKKKGTLNYYCQRWIWKRTYHVLDGWQTKQSSHYAYEFVGRR